METKEKVSEVLNDLLKINNDRIAGYEKAAGEAKEDDLKELFHEMADGSKKITNSLRIEINKLGGDAKVGSTTNSGKIYRVWMDVKATFNGKDREGILKACEYGEDAAQSAYKSAIDGDDLRGNLRDMIMEQKVSLKISHDSIRHKMDEEKITL